jgi:hypothetical protein
LQHEAVQTAGEGLVVAGPGDELCQQAALVFHLGAQQAHLMFDQGQGALGTVGQAQAGGQFGVAQEECRVGLQVGGDGGIPGQGRLGHSSISR